MLCRALRDRSRHEGRNVWLDTAGAEPRWEQAFSPDGGLTWEVNWTAVFRRP